MKKTTPPRRKDGKFAGPPPKTGKPFHATILLDETASMLTHKTETISGFNEYLETLKQNQTNCLVTLVTFNSGKRRTHFKAKSIDDVARLNADNYHPDNTTPLYDAIGLTIQELEARPEAKTHDTQFVILTDGQENASQELSREEVFRLITEKKKKGWTFVFLGANQDSYEQGGKIGIAPSNMKNYRGNQNIRAAFVGLAACTMSYESHPQRSTGVENFWDQEEKKS